VTIATNMAGRGTDIKLGEGVVHVPRELIESQVTLDERRDGGTLRQLLRERPCGLHVIGSERHESRRIDRQLRGRCARQGDPGSSRFYVSLEDDLMRLFGSERIARIMSRLGVQEGEVLEHSLLNRSIETAQRRVEQHNFSIRKRTLEYDDVMNKQRSIIYGFRGDIVRAANPRDQVYDILHDVVLNRADEALAEPSDAARAEFAEWARTLFPVAVTAETLKDAANAEAAGEIVFEQVKQAYDLKVSLEDADGVRMLERHVLLQTIDSHWQDYLRAMDALRQGVGLRAYGQQDPLIEYKREAFTMFGELMTSIKQDIASALFRSSVVPRDFSQFLRRLPRTMLKHDEVAVLGTGRPAPTPDGESAGASEAAAAVTDAMDAELAAMKSPDPFRREAPKVGRNDPCPCGSGKKYKKCCGA
jgi:preprotein translocase subunit SecA